MDTLIVTFLVYCFAFGLLRWSLRKLVSSRCVHKPNLLAPSPFEIKDVKDVS